MALIPCPECAQQISAAAASCPHCGHPRSTQSAGGLAAELRSRFVQVGALLIGLTIASSMAPMHLSSAERLGQGIGLLIVALLFAALVLGWKRATRGYVPLLALLIVLPLAGMLAQAAPATLSGVWNGADQIRTYAFSLEERPDGSIVGTLDYTQPGEGSQHVELTGSRLQSVVLIRLVQSDHTPWVFTGRLLNDATLSGTWSVGDMVLGQLSLTKQ